MYYILIFISFIIIYYIINLYFLIIIKIFISLVRSPPAANYATFYAIYTYYLLFHNVRSFQPTIHQPFYSLYILLTVIIVVLLYSFIKPPIFTIFIAARARSYAHTEKIENKKIYNNIE